ncbi:MAG TPA: tetratricopeptide repeat protein [Candidatus Acidoferrum sp.]|nr:tetratricopeptide repeat protein [Candidatus Acidoferrum sp.]
MTLPIFLRNTPRIVAWALGGFFFVVAQLAAPVVFAQQPQGSSKAKPSGHSTTQKLANPLNDLLDEAQRDIDQNQFEAAITPLQKVLADQPDFAYGHFQLAYVYTALKKPKEAQAEYQRAATLDPKMSAAYVNLGMLLLDNREDAAAVAPLRKAVELLPAESRPRYLLAVALDRSGDRAGAAEAFEALLHLDPNDITAIEYLGWMNLHSGKPAEAEARFRHAVEVQPKEPDGFRGLAESLEAQKKPEAVTAYRQYLELRPDDAEAHSHFIHLLMDQGQNDEALAELDRGDGGKPSVKSLKLRADIQISQKKWTDAIATLQRAIALTPNDAQLHGGLGRTYLQVRDFANAEKELKSAIQLDSKNVGYWKDLSSTYYLSKSYPATLAVLDRIDKFETPGAGSWFIRALCYDSLNQPKPALEAYQKFLELDGNKNPDQVWQAQERSKVLRRMLEGKK